MSSPPWSYQITVGHDHHKPHVTKFSIILASFLQGKFQLLCANYTILTLPLSYIIKEDNTRKIKKMIISALTKFLFIVVISVSSGVLTQIHCNRNFIVLDLMVRMLCRKKPSVFDIEVTTLCIFFNIYISSP